MKYCILITLILLFAVCGYEKAHSGVNPHLFPDASSEHSIEKEETDGLQIYQGTMLIGDVDIPREVRIKAILTGISMGLLM